MLIRIMSLSGVLIRIMSLSGVLTAGVQGPGYGRSPVRGESFATCRVDTGHTRHAASQKP